MVFFLCFSNVALAQEKVPVTFQEIKTSTEQLEKDWDVSKGNTRKNLNFK